MPQVRGSKFASASPSGKKLAGERRRAPRFSLFVRAAKLLANGAEQVCLVRDVSVVGVKVQLFGALPDCSDLRLELANGESFEAELAWREGDHAGLRFREEADLFRLVTIAQGAFPRRQLRLRTGVEGELTTGTKTFPITFENISQRGARVSCKANLAAGQIVRIETSVVEPQFAKVRWRKRPNYGLVFEDLLDFADLAKFAD